MFYEQFKTLEDLIAFADFFNIPHNEMVPQFLDAEEKDHICVFQIEDTPNTRQLMHKWRNR